VKLIYCILIILSCIYSGIKDAAPITSDLSRYPQPGPMMAQAKLLLKEGDLVVRLNADPTSRYIQYFNRTDKRYSHAGIVLVENGQPVIYHIVNGNENPDEKMRKDPIEKFCNPRKNIAFAIFRYKLESAELKRLKKIIQQWYGKGIRFDPGFNYHTNNKMYCSEMISKGLRQATEGRILINKTHLTTVEASLFSGYAHLPFSYTKKLSIVAIDNLYSNKFCELVEYYHY